MTTERTPAFLLANLSSEVARLIAAIEKGDEELSAGALKRTRTVFSALLAMPLRSPAQKEIEMLREVIEDLPKAPRRFSVSAELLESYFSPFIHKVLAL